MLTFTLRHLLTRCITKHKKHNILHVRTIVYKIQGAAAGMARAASAAAAKMAHLQQLSLKLLEKNEHTHKMVEEAEKVRPCCSYTVAAAGCAAALISGK